MSHPYFSDDHERATTGNWLLNNFVGDYSNATLGSCFAGLLTALFIIFKTLEILGYPVWLWFHQAMAALTNVSSNILHNRDSTATGADKDSNMQNGSGKMLSSVFGLNNGLLGKGVRGVTGALSKNYGSNAPAGLGNWDNSCYQNSVIQGMASLPSLRNYLSETTSEYDNLDNETTNGALFDMIDRLNNPEHQGQHFWIRGKLKSMSTWQQQDAQEYYSKVLDELDKEVQKASTRKRESSASWLLNVKNLAGRASKAEEKTEEKEKTSEDEKEQEDDESTESDQPKLAPNPLDGLLAQRVGCINCGYTEGLSMIPFNCITVPLGSGRSHYYDVRECLDEYTKLEYIEGVECAKCTLLKVRDTLTKLAPLPDSPYADRLKAVQEALDEEDFEDKTLKACGIAKKNWSQTTKSRQAVISRAPKALVLHVNRSTFDAMTGAQLKNSAPVEYPPILDLGYWCLGSQPSDSRKLDNAVEERWPKDPNVSMLSEISAPLESMTASPFQYRLRAVVTHFGSHGNGHYVCFRQHPVTKPDSSSIDGDKEDEATESEEQWWRFSDENVYQVPEHAALHQGGVFMLFYERIDGDAQSLQPQVDSDVPATVPASEDIPLASVEEQSEVSDAITSAEAAAPTPVDDSNDAAPLSPPATPERPLDAPFDITPPNVNSAPAAAVYPTPPPEVSAPASEVDVETSEAETTNYDSDEAPSTQVTTDDEADIHADNDNKKDFPPGNLQSPSPGPQRMRTAGSGPNRKDGSRASLPMVSV